MPFEKGTDTKMPAERPHEPFTGRKKGERLSIFPNTKSRERTPGSDDTRIEQFYFKI
jgi:hypothetical protein